MSATNSTPIINLPLFIGTDKPAWLTDWNGAMNTIDTAIANLQTAESGTATSLASLAQSVEALSGTVSQHTTAIQTVTTATAGNAGSINTINSLIGNGEPTTEDKTLIGAINEIYADQGDLSDLTTPAASLVAAINTISGGGVEVDAANVSYDNTTSGLSAANVQAALDKIVANGKEVVIASVEGDGVKTLATLLGELQTALSAANIPIAEGKFLKFFNTDSSVEMTIPVQYYNSDGTKITKANFASIAQSTTATQITSYTLDATSSAAQSNITSGSVTISDVSSNTPPAGRVFKIAIVH